MKRSVFQHLQQELSSVQFNSCIIVCWNHFLSVSAEKLCVEPSGKDQGLGSNK